MATINLSSDQLDNLAQQLLSWKNRINITGMRVKNTVTMVQGWKDPQFSMFLGAISMTQAHLEQYCNSMEQLAKNLKAYAVQQKDLNESFGHNLSKIHN